MVLGLIGGILAIDAACQASDKRHGFMTSAEKKKFDQANARDGIHWGEIEKIAARCRVKTNKYGVAKVTIKKAAIKRLRIKKYIVKTSYLNDVVKSTLIVRR